jgi:hypothetical protein
MIVTNRSGELLCEIGYVWRNGQVCIRFVCEARKQGGTEGEGVYSHGIVLQVDEIRAIV